MSFESILETLDEVAKHYAAGDATEGNRLLLEAQSAAASARELTAVGHRSVRFGRLDIARATFEAALRADPNDLSALKGLVSLGKDHDAAHAERLVQLADTIESEEERASLDMLLGRVFEDLGDYDRSFAFYTLGNALYDKLRGKSYDQLDQRLARYRRNITPDVMARLSGGGTTGLGPIFIVGMPRCGSTLVEQILASHPQVLGGGEMHLINRVIAMAGEEIGSTSLDDVLRSASQSSMTAMADIYLETVRPALRQKSRLADKQLNNFWSVGLIRLMFPDAVVIHCQRDPLDNCFSIFRRSFSTGGPLYAYDLAAIGRQYRRHMSMMEHWDSLLPGFVYKLRYETLIDNFETETRRLIAHCRLEWDDRCLEFYRTERGVKTASVVQVRQPVYRDSIGIAGHFMKHLGPLNEALRG